MAKRDPRNRGLKGNDLLRFKYEELIKRGFEPKYARKLRKNSWDKIDAATDLLKSGMQKQISLNPKQQRIKTKGARKQKAAAPKKKKAAARKKKEPEQLDLFNQPKQLEVPEGYHIRKGYYRGGKWIEPAVVKNPRKRRKGETSFITAVYPKLLIFWRDQTEEIDGEQIIREINSSKIKSMAYLRRDISGGDMGGGYYEQKFGHIGKAEVRIAYNATEEQAILREFYGWTLLYSDTPKYKELLAVLAVLGRYIYEPWKKQNTAAEIGVAAEEINPNVGLRIQDDIGL